MTDPLLDEAAIRQRWDCAHRNRGFGLSITQAFDDVNALLDALAQTRRQHAIDLEAFAVANGALVDYQEREARCCPEDVGFDELIATLRADLAALRSDREGLQQQGWQ